MAVSEEESFEYDYEKESKRDLRFSRQSLDILEEGTAHLFILSLL